MKRTIAVLGVGLLLAAGAARADYNYSDPGWNPGDQSGWLDGWQQPIQGGDQNWYSQGLDNQWYAWDNQNQSWDPTPNGFSPDHLPTSPCPEPSTYALLACGLGMLGWMGRRRARNAAA